MKTISIRIYPDGIVHAETHGIKGSSCKDYLSIIQTLVDARHMEYELKPEYYETEITTNASVIQVQKARTL